MSAEVIQFRDYGPKATGFIVSRETSSALIIILPWVSIEKCVDDPLTENAKRIERKLKRRDADAKRKGAK